MDLARIESLGDVNVHRTHYRSPAWKRRRCKPVSVSRWDRQAGTNSAATTPFTRLWPVYVNQKLVFGSGTTLAMNSGARSSERNTSRETRSLIFSTRFSSGLESPCTVQGEDAARGPASAGLFPGGRPYSITAPATPPPRQLCKGLHRHR